MLAKSAQNFVLVLIKSSIKRTILIFFYKCVNLLRVEKTLIKVFRPSKLHSLLEKKSEKTAVGERRYKRFQTFVMR